MKPTKFLFLLFLVFCGGQSATAQMFTDDASFGINGVVNTDFYMNSWTAENQELYKSYLVDDNKILATGSNQLARFNEEGSLDTGFATDGKFVLPSGYGLNGIEINTNFIYIYGYKANSAVGTDAFVAKLDTDGNVVSGFGTNGYFVFGLNENETFNSLQFTDDNKLLAFGIKRTDPWSKLFITRISQDGTLDTNFQNNGYKEIYVFPINTNDIKYVYQNASNEFVVFCTGRFDVNSYSNYMAVLKVDGEGNTVQGFNNGQTYFESYGGYLNNFKTFNGKVYYTSLANDGSYSDAGLIRRNPETLAIETSVNVHWDVSDFLVDENENITVLSTGNYNYSIPENRDVDVRKYSRESEDDSYTVEWGYHFNLSDINSFNTDDLPSNLHFYDDKMLITGNSQIPQSGVNGMKYTMRRFNFNPLSNDEFGKKNVYLYPNPVSDIVNMDVSALDFPLTVDIFNTAGQLVNHQLLKDNLAHISIDMSTLPSGIYYVSTKDGNTVSQTNKLIKQ